MERRGDAEACQLPRREARALQPGPRLRAVDRHPLALLPRGANHSQRSAVTGGCERTGVAVRQDAPRIRKQLRAVTSDGPVGRDVLRLHGMRHIEDARSRLVRRGACVRGVEASLHRPAEVHGGGPGSRQRRGVIPQLGEEPGHGGGSDVPCGDGHRVSGGNADGRRAPHLHRAYRDDSRVHGVDVYPLCARWEFRLVQQNEVLVLPDDGMYLFGGFH